jgi:deoxyribonuclease-4
VFAAGYDLGKPDGYCETMERLGEILTFRRIRCLHLNDSKSGCGSRVDRHEHIGRGKLGLRAFARLVNDRRLIGAARILETPKGKDARGRDLDAINLSRLRRLVGR